MTMLIVQVPHCIYINSKVNNCGTEIANMNYFIFGHIKGTNYILADSTSHLRSIQFYDSLEAEGKGKEFGHDIFTMLYSLYGH